MLSSMLLLALLAPVPSESARCSVRRVNSDGSPGPRVSAPAVGPEELVRRTPVIVRVVAVRQVAREGAHMPHVVFRVTEVLKGDVGTDSLEFGGYPDERDDLNPRPVPYRFRRDGTAMGSCFAYRYRLGAEYLLLLNRDSDGLTPYYGIFSPTNEQLRGEDDPWLLWVRAQVALNHG